MNIPGVTKILRKSFDSLILIIATNENIKASELNIYCI